MSATKLAGIGEGEARGREAAHAFLDRDLGLVAKIAPGAADVEVVRPAKLGGEKAGHARFGLDSQQAVGRFEASADAPGGF